MTPFETARRHLHANINSNSLRAFDALLVEREKELIEEMAGAGNPVEVQHKFQELRLMREALTAPAFREKASRDAG